MKFDVTDRSGHTARYEVASLGDLYDTLSAEMKIDAICGGACSCATCHVLITDNTTMLHPASAEEIDILDGLMHRARNSRLLCQLRADAEIQNLSLTIAPEE
ncbi:2Fe-2S iron-sulfur cluster-binding protein [Spongiibacter taiwanensis]|uniref:2Fe-2S iron-sulfur cluster-binding protein n=1 Tax=Spongiibacter taiwanensis TaxID=1748242 RepID=UPI0020362E3D|nr:2Fe-2S iron-sulfur cluster-binding protein [Spongiibacter taiwanensis]USA42496.1 2Fe-2S iron-sulfur cluster-binding protein [Spongiibacter taiwanensis]